MKQKSHKLLSLLLTFALMLSLAPTALAANHTHVWSDWEVVQTATCTRPEIKERHCVLCSEGRERQETKAPGHKYGAAITITPAACETPGVKKRTCSVCGYEDIDEITPLGHDYRDVAKGVYHGTPVTTQQPTCATSGQQVRQCSRAGCNDVTVVAKPATGKHIPKTSTIKPNADGKTHSYTCTTCGTKITDEKHNYVNGVCTLCGAVNPSIEQTITLNYTSRTINVAEQLQLVATVVPANAGADSSVTWSSSRTDIALVSNTGLVIGQKAGKATITATTGKGKTAQCVVTVTDRASSGVLFGPASVDASVNDWTYVSVNTNDTDGYYVDWSVPNRNGAARISANRNTSYLGYSVDSTRISTNGPASIYVYGDARGPTTLTATLRTQGGTRITSIDIPVSVGNSSSKILSASHSSITTNYNGWSSSVYVTTPSGYDGYYVDWSTSGNVYVSKTTNTSNPDRSTYTYISGRTSGSVYVYASGSGYLTAILRESANSSREIDRITIPVNTSNTGYTLDPNPSTGSTIYLGYYDDYYYYDRYSRDFSVTPRYNGSSILNTSGYSITYTWTLNGHTVGSNSRSYTLSSSNSYLNRNSYNNTLSCSARIYSGNTYRDTPTVTWNVRTDYYYDDGYTFSATVYDTNSGYDLDERDDKGGSSIISQMQSRLGSREDIDYVRFSSVSSTYGDLSASTSRDYYYYSSSRGSYDLRDVTFTPSRVGRTGTATFGCTIYGTRGSVYHGTIRITVTDGDSTNSGDIKYTAKAGAAVDFSASDFRSWWRDSYSRGDLDYVRFSSPSGGSLYINYSGSNSSTVGSTNCYYTPSRSQTGISDLTFVPSSSSTKSASVRFTAYGTTSSSSSSNTSMSGTVTITYSGVNTNAATINYSTTGTKSITLSASDFTSRYRDVMDASAPSNTTIRFRSVPSNGTLAIGNTTITSSNMGSYNFSTSSSGSNRISDVKYTPKSNTSYTETVNYDCYTGSTFRFSGTITFKNTADSQAVTNVSVSYSTTGGNVSFNATDFIVGKGSAMAGSNYVVFGAPTSGSLYVGSAPLVSGSKVSYVAASGMQLLGSVSYHPASGFNGTATIPFTAYNANGTTAATGTVSILVSQATTPSRTSFGDVPSTAWFYNDVTTLAAANIVKGRNDGLFHPNDSVNYGEALKLILLAAGYPQQTEGSGAAWAQNYLQLAIDQKILPGTAANYSLSAAMNRTTIATVAAKALKLTPVTNEASPYADAVDAEGYVLALTKAGIVQGDNSSGKWMWNGSDNLTRAQISRIVYNVYKYRNVAPGGNTASVDTNKPSWLN